MKDVLPDILANNLRVVFCGTAVSSASAGLRAYYAGPGNKFWRTLFEIGLTPHKLSPSQYPELPDYGIGLTDLAKKKSGSDSALSGGDFDREALREKILVYRPRCLCFNGKKAAKHFFDQKRVGYGLQKVSVGDTKLFVAPSTSGAASGYWDIALWRELAALCRVE